MQEFSRIQTETMLPRCSLTGYPGLQLSEITVLSFVQTNRIKGEKKCTKVQF